MVAEDVDGYGIAVVLLYGLGQHLYGAGWQVEVVVEQQQVGGRHLVVGQCPLRHHAAGHSDEGFAAQGFGGWWTVVGQVDQYLERRLRLGLKRLQQAQVFVAGPPKGAYGRAVSKRLHEADGLCAPCGVCWLWSTCISAPRLTLLHIYI